MFDELAEDIGESKWHNSYSKRSHDQKMAQLGDDQYRLSNSIAELRQQIEEKKRAVQEREALKQEYQRYVTDCEKLEYLTTRDLAAARTLLRAIYDRYPKFVKVDPTFEGRFKRFLDAETQEFGRRLGEIVI